MRLSEIATDEMNRCIYTVHGARDWGDCRCELINKHEGGHAIGIREHAVPLVAVLEREIERLEAQEKASVKMAFLEVVAYAAKHYVASGYEKPCEPWRQPLIDALVALSDNYKSSLC